MTKRSQGLRRPVKAKRSQGVRKPVKAKRPLKGSAQMSGTKKAKSGTMDFRGAVRQQLSEWSAQVVSDIRQSGSASLSRLVSRSKLTRIMHDAERFRISDRGSRAGDPSVWRGVRQLAVQHVWD
jgi:hypothetical protein